MASGLSRWAELGAEYRPEASRILTTPAVAVARKLGVLYDDGRWCGFRNTTHLPFWFVGCLMDTRDVLLRVPWLIRVTPSPVMSMSFESAMSEDDDASIDGTSDGACYYNRAVPID